MKWFLAVASIVALSCNMLAGVPVKDDELRIAPEDQFDPLTELTLEEINSVTLYDQHPKNWLKIELEGKWRLKKLGGSPETPLTEEQVKSTEKELLGPNPPEGSAWSAVKDGVLQYQKIPTPRLFATAFELPKGFDVKEQSCRLFFEQAHTTEIFVNGKKVMDYQGTAWATPLDLDITEHVKPGRNTLALTGVPGQGSILVTPSVYAKRMLINPDVGRNDLNVELRMQNNRAEPVKMKVRADVNHWKQKEIVAGKEVELELAPGETWHDVKIQMNDPVLWSPDNPHLYEIRIFDGKGQCLAKDRFGFREFVAKGNRFYLNGKPIPLFGMQWGGDKTKGLSTEFIAPLKSGEGYLDYFKRFHYAYLKGFKTAGLNCIRPHSAAGNRGRDLFEVCDELGILHYDDWRTYGELRNVNNPEQAERMEKAYDRRAEWVYYGYNHPSTVMYSFGNERYTTPRDTMNAIYHAMKPVDKQSRPMCSSSGRISGSILQGRKDHIDFADDHSYYGSMRGSWLYNWEYIREVKDGLDEMYGKDTMPLVNFELGGGFPPRYNGHKLVYELNKILTAEPADRAGYVQAATRYGDYGWEVVTRLTMLKGGIRTVNTDEKAAWMYSGEDLRRILELIRQQDVMVGTGPHQAGLTMPYAYKNRNCMAAVTNRYPDMKVKNVVIDPTRKEFVKTPPWYAMKRCYRLESISARWFDRNLIAGSGKIKADIYAINDTRETHDYSARILFRDPDGKTLKGDTIEFGTLEPNGRKIEKYSYALPADLATGEYRLEMFLFRDGKRINDNYYQVRVFGRGDVTMDLKTDKKVALYDSSGETEKALEAVKLKYSKLKDFGDLGKYDVLIVGADSIDDPVFRAGEQIREWVEKGGRLLCFEQEKAGYIPWVTSMRFLTGEASEQADIVDPAHPAFDGLEKKHFDTWNGKGVLFSTAIGPKNGSAVAICPVGYVMSDAFAATAIADILIGKGISVICALDAIERYGDDAVATILVNNLLKYLVSDETKYSREVKVGKKVDFLETSDCVPIDLKPCFNNSFIDEEASDGKGGWDDYGPKNDLRNMETGDLVLLGVPFTVVDPRKNDDKSCVTLKSKRWPHHPENVEIKVDGMFNQLFFLHTSTCTPKVKDAKGEPLYRFVVRFADGTSDELPIRAGFDVVDWNYADDDLPGSRIAWRGMNDRNRPATLFLTAWTNPHPDKKIVGVEFVGSGRNVPILVGLTGYKGTLARGWLSKEHTHHLTPEQKEKKKEQAKGIANEH